VPDSQVTCVATEIDPYFLHTLSNPNLEVRRHDIQTEGLPKHQFYLAHAHGSVCR
jgi:hypothetical protein